MSYINGYNADVWINQNHPENGWFRVYWKDVIGHNSGGGTFDLTSWPTFFYMDRDMVIRDVDKGYNGGEVIYSIEWLLTL